MNNYPHQFFGSILMETYNEFPVEYENNSFEETPEKFLRLTIRDVGGDETLVGVKHRPEITGIANIGIFVQKGSSTKEINDVADSITKDILTKLKEQNTLKLNDFPYLNNTGEDVNYFSGNLITNYNYNYVI